MDKKVIIIIFLVLIATIILIGVNMQLNQKKPMDATVEIENIQFNISNNTTFKLSYTNGSDLWSVKTYLADNLNETGYNVQIFTGSDSEYFNLIKNQAKIEYGDKPVQELNGTIIYTTTASVGEFVGQTRYVSIIENANLNMVVVLWSNNPNETVKMTKTLKFTNKTIENNTVNISDESVSDEVATSEPRYTNDSRGTYDNEKQEYTNGQAQGLSKNEAQYWEDKIERDGGMV